MNIENISSLVKQLQSLGFENSGYSLLKRISFKPHNFVLSQKIEKGKDKMAFHLFFERGKENIYVLLYYDAQLKNEQSLISPVINNINIANLEKAMAEIDWKSAFDFFSVKQLNLNDNASWEKEEKVESIIEALSSLEQSEEAKVISTELKLKHWAGSTYQEMFGHITPVKTKSEISQRFYCASGQPGISVDEAYRFLQNKLLEKQIFQRKKPPENVDESEADSKEQPESSNGLVRKKRINGKRNSRKQH